MTRPHPSLIPSAIGLLTQDAWRDPLQKAELNHAHGIEFRVDTFDAPLEEIHHIFRSAQLEFPGKFWILTCRLQRDGGRWPDHLIMERAEFLEWALTEHATWIDLESYAPAWIDFANQRRRATQSTALFLFSVHDFQASGNLEELSIRIQNMQHPTADALKLALFAQTEEDLLAMEQFLRTTTHSTPVASCFSMGQLGQKTRLSSPEWGAPWSYGYTGTTPQAPGQIHIIELAQHLSTLRTQM